MEQFAVYIIYSLEKDKYYVGHTEDISRRVSEHRIRKNLGAEDWILKYSESYSSRSAAMKREYEIKSKKKRSYLEWLISQSG